MGGEWLVLLLVSNVCRLMCDVWCLVGCGWGLVDGGYWVMGSV